MLNKEQLFRTLVLVNCLTTGATAAIPEITQYGDTQGTTTTATATSGTEPAAVEEEEDEQATALDESTGGEDNKEGKMRGRERAATRPSIIRLKSRSEKLVRRLSVPELGVTEHHEGNERKNFILEAEEKKRNRGREGDAKQDEHSHDEDGM